jgi:hypothetical protein
MEHDIAGPTCYTEAAPRQGTKHFREFVAKSSHTHVAPNDDSVGRLKPMYRALDYEKDVVVVASPQTTWRGASSFSPPVQPEIHKLGWIFGIVAGVAASLQGVIPNGGGCVSAVKAFVWLPSSDAAALRGIHTLQARRAVVVMVDTHSARWLAVVRCGSALLTLAWPSSLHVLAGLLHHMMIIHIFNGSQVSLFVLSSASLGALSSHTRRESCMLWPLLVGDNRRSWRSEDSSPTIGWVTVRVEQPSTRLRAILQRVHAPLRMVGSKHGRGPFLKLECVASHGTLAEALVGAHRDFIRPVLGDSCGDLKVVDRALRSTQSTTNIGACPTKMEQQRHRVLAANATELTKIFQVFVKNLQGKSITVNNVTGLIPVEDLKFNVQEKTEMRGVWPELKYQSELLHDGKTLSAYGIDQGATLEMTWLLLGGGRTPAPAPNTGAATSHTKGSNIFQLDESIAAEVGPRTRSISSSIKAADDDADTERDAACGARSAFVNERAMQQQDATDSQAMAESSGHMLPHMMDVPIVESLEDYIDHAADALPHNMASSNVAREAPGLDSAAGNGADALEASLASESAGVLCALTVAFAHTRRHAHRKQEGRLHFIL